MAGVRYLLGDSAKRKSLKKIPLKYQWMSIKTQVRIRIGSRLRAAAFWHRCTLPVSGIRLRGVPLMHGDARTNKSLMPVRHRR
jgi:hypothetical protein